jgi:hypothetical protein
MKMTVMRKQTWLMWTVILEDMTDFRGQREYIRADCRPQGAAEEATERVETI